MKRSRKINLRKKQNHNMNDELITKAVQEAPSEIKALLSNGAWLAKADEISERSNFSEEQQEALKKEILIVLLSLDLKQNFMANILENLNIAKDIALEISLEIDEEIFASVSKYLPTEIEAETEPESILETGNDHLIEDSLGNSDNNVPAQVDEVTILDTTPDNLPGLTPVVTPVDEKLSNLVDQKKATENDEDFEKRKQAIAEGEKIVQKAYSDKPDPYRELPI